MLANSTAAAKKTDQPGIWEMQKSYLLNPENSKTFLILSQPKMCQKYTFLLPRAHFLGATGAPTEPVHESLLKTPILSRPTKESAIPFYGNHPFHFITKIFFLSSPSFSCLLAISQASPGPMHS